MNNKNPKDKALTSSQKNIFRLITFIIPFVILIAIEGFLRVFNYGDNLNLFIQNPMQGYENYQIVNPIIGKKYFQKLEYTAPANDIFLTDKSDNTFRIFVMGSSTVYGFPHDRNLMFSRILQKRLEDVYPNKNIEVINTAITAINSFTLNDFTDEIIAQKPDMVLIYAGHNEFYGAFGIGSNETMGSSRMLTQLHVNLMSLRVYQLLRNGIAKIAQNIATNKKEAEHGTLMKRIVANKDIALNSEEYNIAMKRYSQNMNAILTKFNKKDIPIFFSEVVSNVKDLPPFQSVSDDKPESENALKVYLKAKSEEENKNYELALNNYKKARDLDCIRFRASSEVNKIINKLAIIHNTHIIPMEKFFQDASPNKLIGNNLMTEHVHPNSSGQFLMAEAFYREILRSELIGEPNTNNLKSLTYFIQNWGYTNLDDLISFHRIELLKNHWPFTNSENTADYRINYKPKSIIDSIAFSVVKYSNIKSENVRLELARDYDAKKLYLKAYKEYLALYCSSPNMAINNRDLGTALVKISNINDAIYYFKKSLQFDDTFYANFKVGELYLLKSDYVNAIEYFKRAYPLAPEDKKLSILLKTYVALVYNNQKSEANELALKIKTIKPELNFNIPPKQYVFDNYIPLQVKPEVESAIQFLKKGNKIKALQILMESLKKYDSSIANKYIGGIFFDLGDIEKAAIYYNKVYDIYKFDTKFLHNYTLLLATKKDFEKANACIDQLTLIEPNYPPLDKLKSFIKEKSN